MDVSTVLCIAFDVFSRYLVSSSESLSEDEESNESSSSTPSPTSVFVLATSFLESAMSAALADSVVVVAVPASSPIFPARSMPHASSGRTRSRSRKT